MINQTVLQSPNGLNLGDTGKVLTSDDDKCGGLYESSTDSGFISSSNLIVSGEILSEEIKEENVPPPTGVIHEDNEDDDDKEENHMRLDSGVCLSESFSNLSLKSPGLNDLSCSKSTILIPTTVIQHQQQSIDDAPWKIYYEQDEDGDTHLHSSIIENFPEVALALIRAVPHPRLLDTPNDDSQTPLHLAALTRQFRIVRWLIVAGARPCPRDVHGDSPLHIAARNGDLNCVKAIIDPIEPQERAALQLNYQQQGYQRCDLDQWNYVGQTCVHVAAQNGYVDVLRHLVWHGADINAREGCMGYSVLHYAVERCDEMLVQFLLTECGKFDPHLLTYGGRTALETAIGVPKNIGEALRSKGLPSPYISDDEEFESDEDDEQLPYENTKMFVSNLVGASA